MISHGSFFVLFLIINVYNIYNIQDEDLDDGYNIVILKSYTKKKNTHVTISWKLFNTGVIG